MRMFHQSNDNSNNQMNYKYIGWDKQPFFQFGQRSSMCHSSHKNGPAWLYGEMQPCWFGYWGAWHHCRSRCTKSTLNHSRSLHGCLPCCMPQHGWTFDFSVPTFHLKWGYHWQGCKNGPSLALIFWDRTILETPPSSSLLPTQTATRER